MMTAQMSKQGSTDIISPKAAEDDGLLNSNMVQENQSEAPKQGVNLPDITQKMQSMAASRSDPALNLPGFQNE